MPEQVDVYYDGWGEHWRWGRLVSSNAITGRPLIAFEYSDEAKRRGLELSAYTLALNGPKLRKVKVHSDRWQTAPLAKRLLSTL